MTLPGCLQIFVALTVLAISPVAAQVHAVGSIRCQVDAIGGFINCTGHQPTYSQKPIHEVLLEAAAQASSIERNRAIADAMRAQANLLRAQAQQQAKAAAMDRVVALIASAEKVDGEAREALLKIASEELQRFYPARSFPPGSTVLVPMSDDGWDRLACERMKLQLGSIHIYDGTFSDSSSLSGVKLLVVNMTPDANHDTMEVFMVDEGGSRSWSEKVGFAWTLNYERQTTKLADRMAQKIKSRL